jgi:HSP20 family protein
MEAKGKNEERDCQRRLQTEVDKMFLELLRGERTPRYGKVAFRPNADVYYDKSQKTVVVKLELPGIDPHAVDLEIDENVLRVSGVRSYPHHPDAVYQQMEITYGRFERVVALPPEVDSGKATAHYGGGFLEILLPVKPRSNRKRIPITATEEGEEGQEL